MGLSGSGSCATSGDARLAGGRASSSADSSLLELLSESESEASLEELGAGDIGAIGSGNFKILGGTVSVSLEI